ncbi:uncharacterized protein LOC132192964 isoform X2 [Neocloeon triangulifer]|uniref:uncharacterized protein LOC132192964 isoform X2 n=1 Tax=Neocloeon triangulifer TaxID=2078957 RepID=UPI00286F93D4|nr:uncharacterized protein LOC132192964 isoform X2 [Neocloeon triangulifer]
MEAGTDLIWFQTQIDSYPKCRDHKGVLNQFIKEIKSMDTAGRQQLLPQLKFQPMFDTLVKWNNPIYAKPFYELVSLVFENCDAGKIVSENEDLLLEFLGHVSTEFCTLLFNVLDRAISESGVSCFKKSPQLMYKLVQSISSEEADLDSQVLSLLEKIIAQPEGAKLVFGSDIGQWLGEMCEMADIRFRVFELASTAACGSAEGLEFVKTCNILQELESGLQGAMAHVDQVGFAATVDCFTKLGATSWGYKELLESGVLSKLEARVVEYGPGTMEDKVMPSVYTFFGQVFKHFPEQALKDCPKVVPTVMNLIDISIDRAYVTRTEMEMIGMVAAKPAGKRHLAKLDPPVTLVLSHLKQFISSGSSVDKICAIETVSSLIALQDKDQTEEMLAITKTWFEVVWTSVEVLFHFCQEPFPGINRTSIPVFVSETVQCRNSGLQLLSTLANLAWGRTEICKLPSLLNWLAEGELCQDVHFSTNGVPSAESLQLKQDVANVILNDAKTPEQNPAKHRHARK